MPNETENSASMPQHTPEQLREHAGEACALLKTLANVDRLMLLCSIGTARRNVSELEAATGINQPTLSQQLAILRQEGMGTTDKEGKYIYYRLVDVNAMRIMGTLWEIFCATSPASHQET